MRTHTAKAVVLLLAAVPFLGSTCTEEKVVDLVIGFPTTVQLVASGSTNTVMTTGRVDVMADLDVPGALEDAGIDVFDLDKNEVKVVQVFYRVAVPDAEPTRMVTGASLRAARVDATTGNPIGINAVLINGWSAPFGTGAVDPAEWIDITDLLGSAGLTLLNDYMYELLCSLQDGTPMVNPEIEYRYSGTSAPTSVATSFEYEIKVLFQAIVPQPFEIPFG